MPRARMAVIAVIAVPIIVMLGSGCGSDSGAAKASGPSTTRPAASATALSVHGVATAPAGPAADPTSEPAKIPFSGTVDCRAGHPTGTGMFATSASETCTQIAARHAVLARVGTDPGRMCSEIYGGPQEARIKGTVSGAPVRIRVTRSDGCGIADWTTLQWLLGPPER